MTVRPLGERVLVKPFPQETMTESGLHLVEHKKPDEMGTVVAVGFARHPKKEEAEQFADRYDGGTEIDCELAALLRDLVRKQPSVKVGDTVLFSWASGQELTLNDGAETYLLLKESDLLAVLED